MKLTPTSHYEKLKTRPQELAAFANSLEHDLWRAREEIFSLRRKLALYESKALQYDRSQTINNDVLLYVLQSESNNRTTPRIIDIAYTAFMIAKQPNAEDGGESDWFTDTKPVITLAIEKICKDLKA